MAKRPLDKSLPDDTWDHIDYFRWDNGIMESIICVDEDVALRVKKDRGCSVATKYLKASSRCLDCPFSRCYDDLDKGVVRLIRLAMRAGETQKMKELIEGS